MTPEKFVEYIHEVAKRKVDNLKDQFGKESDFALMVLSEVEKMVDG